LILPILLLVLSTPSGTQASEAHSPSSTLLRDLRIKKAKRGLRLSGNATEEIPAYCPLKNLYAQNQFEDLINSTTLLSKSQKSAAVFLIEGNSFFFMGNLEQAVSSYQQAFRLASKLQEKAAAMANFGVVFSEKGRWKEAVHWLERALQIDRKSDDWEGQGIALSLLGNFYLQSGDTEKGTAAHIESLEIAETIPIPWLEARQLTFLANLYYGDRIFHIADNNYRKSLLIYQELKDPLGEAASLSGLGFVLKDLGKFDEALEMQSKALQIYQKLGDLQSEIKVRVNLSLLHRERGDFKAALDAGEVALKLQEDLGDILGMAGTEGTLGSIYQKKGNLKKAIRHLKKARQYFEEGGASQEIHIVDLTLQALQDQLN